MALLLDHAEVISGRREYVFCNSDQQMDPSNNRFLYLFAHLITVPGFLIRQGVRMSLGTNPADP